MPPRRMLVVESQAELDAMYAPDVSRATLIIPAWKLQGFDKELFEQLWTELAELASVLEGQP